MLLTGASGLVGSWLRRTAPAGVELVPLVHQAAIVGTACPSADLRDERAVAALCRSVGPSLIIHAAMAVDAASIIDATENVVRGASLVGAEVVFISTDAVFGGDGRPRAETAPSDPVWDYGRWKAEAETSVRSGATAGSAIVRLPLVVSLDPEDHATERIRRGALERRPTRWFHDEVRQPAMASDIAAGLWRIVSLPPERRSGVWHLPGPESLTRYQIARRVTDALRLDPSSVVAVPTPADTVRPRHLDLRCDRASAEIGWDPGPILA